jgi:hypothetical protein
MGKTNDLAACREVLRARPFDTRGSAASRAAFAGQPGNLKSMGVKENGNDQMASRVQAVRAHRERALVEHVVLLRGVAALADADDTRQMPELAEREAFPAVAARVTTRARSTIGKKGTVIKMNEKEPPESNGGAIQLKTLLPLIIAIVYALSPLDIIPDIPGIGWIDDGGVVIAAALNLLQNALPGFLGTAVKYIKWIFIALCAIAVLIIGLILTLILKIVL